MSFVYCICGPDGSYDPEEAFDDAKDAIYAAIILKKDVAVLDALSLEFLGYI